MLSRSPSLLVGAVLFGCSAVCALESMSDSVLAKVKAHAIAGSTLSWENGTLARALTEFDNEDMAPFSANFLPPWSSEQTNGDLTTLAFAALDQKVKEYGFLSLDGSWRSSVNGSRLQIVPDGSAGDPASLGEVVIWANWTGQTYREEGKFSIAAEEQNASLSDILKRHKASNLLGDNAEGFLAYQLINVVPRTPDGAISHRMTDVQLWSDSTYMVPPFLAYYAALTSNQTMMTEAYNQCRLYRQYLGSDSGLWKHIQLGNDGGQDPGNWGTGNAWAAAGMMRVLATMKHSQMSSSFESQQADLQKWIEEIMRGAYSHQLTTGLQHDYLDNKTSFPDASCTALLAATAYRLSSLSLSDTWVPYAEKAYRNISTTLSASDSDGWLKPVVDPYAWGKRGSNSPEGQSFVLIMESARRAWKNSGSRNETGQSGPGEEDGSTVSAASLIVETGRWPLALVAVSLGAMVLI